MQRGAAVQKYPYLVIFLYRYLDFRQLAAKNQDFA